MSNFMMLFGDAVRLNPGGAKVLVWPGMIIRL